MRLQICITQVSCPILSINCVEIIHRSWSQSSNSVAHTEGMSEHEEHCNLLSSSSTHIQKCYWHALNLDRYCNDRDAFLECIVNTD